MDDDLLEIARHLPCDHLIQILCKLVLIWPKIVQIWISGCCFQGHRSSLEGTGFCTRHDGACTTRDRLFAEYQVDCRVFFLALGKELLCPERKKTLSKKNTWQRRSLPTVFLTLGKEASLPSVFFYSAKKLFAKCFFYTRQRKFQSTF